MGAVNSLTAAWPDWEAKVAPGRAPQRPRRCPDTAAGALTDDLRQTGPRGNSTIRKLASAGTNACELVGSAVLVHPSRTQYIRDVALHAVTFTQVTANDDLEPPHTCRLSWDMRVAQMAGSGAIPRWVATSVGRQTCSN